MDEATLLITIFGMMVVTYVPRALPALVLSQRPMHPALARWLSYVPAAVLSALLMPSLLAPEKTLDLSLNNIFLLAAVPTFVVCFKTRSFFGTVAVGMVLVALLRLAGMG